VVRAVSDPSIRAGGHAIQISHPDKALFADPTITNPQLARHYERMAPAMLPLIRDRPLELEVFPARDSS
jgi:bifunctional non-homologous end joining protein LigD